MKKFKSKNYTIPEGHYTGPQQATVDSWTKAATEAGLIGAGIGGVKGYLSDEGEDKNKSSVQKVIEGAGNGYLYGMLAGMAIKGIADYINKPLKDIDFQKLDKNIRAEFGSYKIPIINKSVGSEEKIKKLSDKIVYNNRNITDFKLNFGIRRNQIVMYTFGVTDEELDSLSQSLDDYVRENANMNYNASLINKSQNSYAVSITFTTYNIAARYIIEASGIVQGKVNIIDKDYIISRRVGEFNVDKLEDPDVKAGIEDTPTVQINNNIYNTVNNDDSIKTFSIGLTKDEEKSALDFLRSDGIDTIFDIVKSIKTKKVGATASNHLTRLINHAVGKVVEKGKMKAGLPVKREDLNTSFLLTTLTKLRYVKGYNYTIDKDNSECNLSLVSGILIVSADKGEKSELIDEEFYKKGKDRIRRSEIDTVVSYLYSVVSRQDLEFLLKKLFSTKLKFNVIP